MIQTLQLRSLSDQLNRHGCMTQIYCITELIWKCTGSYLITNENNDMGSFNHKLLAVKVKPRPVEQVFTFSIRESYILVFWEIDVRHINGILRIRSTR